MPIYDVECNDCSNVFEVLQKYGEQAPRCGTCFSTDTQIRISCPNIAREHDPYDALDKGMPGKSIKSFGNDRRKGGKDTT